MSAPSLAIKRPPARDRLLAAADELFYAEGVHTVGIDRVIERAGVAKASLYSTFGNKEGLVKAYLEGRHERRRARLLAGLAQFEDPRDRLLGVFDVVAGAIDAPTFRGCAFYNASAESSTGGQVQDVCDTTRAWTRGLFIELARDAGVPDPEALTEQLMLLYDGAMVGARMDRQPGKAAAARRVAEVLVDAAMTRS
jgi:AcrR family transcriptional regulator